MEKTPSKSATLRKMATPAKASEQSSTRRGSSRSSANGKSSYDAADLLARLGDLVHTEKGGGQHVFCGSRTSSAQGFKVVGGGQGVLSLPLNIYAFKRAMQRAWGHHHA